MKIVHCPYCDAAIGEVEDESVADAAARRRVLGDLLGVHIEHDHADWWIE